MKKLSKLFFALLHPVCWRGLIRRVAPAIEHQKLLSNLDYDCLFDVGANRGQFSLVAKSTHPKVPIVAFEPQPLEASVYREVFHGVHGVELREVALGDTKGEADLHISKRRDSSSLLPIGELQSSLFPRTEEVGTHRVTVETLDNLLPGIVGYRRILLKLDVQGFELGVLRGSTRTLERCAFVYAECSSVPLYTGQALYPEVEALLLKQGFQPLKRINEHFNEGKLIQADYLFGRRTAE